MSGAASEGKTEKENKTGSQHIFFDPIFLPQNRTEKRRKTSK